MGTVIFDFDGTLADTVDLAVRTYNEFAPRFKTQTLEKDEIPGLLAMGYFKAARSKHVRWTVVPRLILTVSREMKKHIHEVKPYPEVLDAIVKLKEQGYVVGVLTSNQEDLVKEFFVNNKFPEFDFVVSEKSLFGKDKALKRIMRTRQLDSSEVVYVGDEPRDVTASRRARVKIIAVSWGIAGKDGYTRQQPDRIASSGVELVRAVHDLLN